MMAYLMVYKKNTQQFECPHRISGCFLLSFITCSLFTFALKGNVHVLWCLQRNTGNGEGESSISAQCRPGPPRAGGAFPGVAVAPASCIVPSTAGGVVPSRQCPQRLLGCHYCVFLGTAQDESCAAAPAGRTHECSLASRVYYVPVVQGAILTPQLVSPLWADAGSCSLC